MPNDKVFATQGGRPNTTRYIDPYVTDIELTGRTDRKTAVRQVSTDLLSQDAGEERIAKRGWNQRI